jgi:aspartate aminotransferase
MELQSIASVARNNNLIIISDEIYGLLSFKNEYVSIAKYYPEGTIVSTGLSKWCGAGGWRLGAFIIPDALKDLYQTLITLASETFSAVSTPIQYAAVIAYSNEESLITYRKQAVIILEKVSKYCSAAMRSFGVSVKDSDGGFYLFPNFEIYKLGLMKNGINSSKEFCTRLLEETGVALLPGSVFGRPQEEFTARFCYVDFDGTKALEHLTNHIGISDSDFETLFLQMIKGVEKMRIWLQKFE